VRRTLPGLGVAQREVIDVKDHLRIARLLNDDNLESADNILSSVEAIAARLEESDDIITDLRAAVSSLDQAAQDISLAADGIAQFGVTAEAFLIEDVNPMLADVSSAAIEVDRASRETYALLASMQPGLEEFTTDGLPQLSAAARDLRSLVAALERIALELEQDPAGFVSQPAGQQIEVPQ
jgi:phospholipid/cholesterol/gamma-HCH transport system substrate-binding protein